MRLLLVFVGSVFFSSQSFSQSENILKDKYVIVLHMQEHYLKTLLSDSSTQELMNNVNAVIEKSDPEKVIYYKSVYTTLSFPSFKLDTIHGPRKLDNRLKIVNNNIFEKNKPNAFSEKELTNLINKGGTKEIIVVGIIADYEVSKTLLGGKKLGYNMYMIPEAIGVCCKKSKEAIISKLLNKGIQLLETEFPKN